MWLACLYSIVPAIFKFVAVPILWRYPLTEDKLQEIQAEIAAAKQPAQTG
jgi:Na+/melibiose symporter-like transporter